MVLNLRWLTRARAVVVVVCVKLQALVYDILPSRRKVPESGARSVTLCMQTEFSSPRKELWTRQDSSIRRAQQSKTDCPCGFENQEE